MATGVSILPLAPLFAWQTGAGPFQPPVKAIHSAANARLAIKVACWSIWTADTPYFYWTLDDFEDLKLEQNRESFDGAVWRRNAISSYSIGASHLTFDAPLEWDEGSRPVRFVRTADGMYEHQFEDTIYAGVRADTQHHVILTADGRKPIMAEAFSFLCCQPRRLKNREPFMEALPVGGDAPVAAASIRW